MSWLVVGSFSSTIIIFHGYMDFAKVMIYLGKRKDLIAFISFLFGDYLNYRTFASWNFR